MWITEQQILDTSTSFQNSSNKLLHDIAATYKNDEKDERKYLEKHLALNNAILTNLRKLRNLIASKST